MASHGMKTYIKNRIELQNPQILKKMLEKSRPFCLQSNPVSQKDVALNTAGGERICSENLWLWQFDQF